MSLHEACELESIEAREQVEVASDTAQFGIQGSQLPLLSVPKLLAVTELCATFGVSRSWVYQRTTANSPDPLPVVRLGPRTVRFDPAKVFLYLRARERYRPDATLDQSDGDAPINGKGHFKLTRKRFQAGSVRLREDRGPAYWEGFYRETVVIEAEGKKRRRKSVHLGLLTDVRTKKAAQQKLAVILEPINCASNRPKKLISFGSFVKTKYKPLKLVNLKGTTKDGYETNIRFHFLPEFGDCQLADINLEAVQAFLNRKTAEGKSVQTVKNLKWGLSSIFKLAIKYGYITSNPAKGADLPPEPVKERAVLPDHGQLNALIQALPEPASTMVWLVAVGCVRPDELAFRWPDLEPEKQLLWIVRAVNRGKIHTPKYHRSNRPIRLTKEDVDRLLKFKQLRKLADDDWMFPNRIKNGKKMKRGPIRHEELLGRVVQPAADRLGLPHITWRLLRHWGATQMVEGRVPIKAAQERLGHSRPDIVLKHYAHVLDASADMAAATLSSGLVGMSPRLESAYLAAS